eukprot:3507307-Ditylum_brightwellii.AAC.1
MSAVPSRSSFANCVSALYLMRDFRGSFANGVSPLDGNGGYGGFVDVYPSLPLVPPSYEWEIAFIAP